MGCASSRIRSSVDIDERRCEEDASSTANDDATNGASARARDVDGDRARGAEIYERERPWANAKDVNERTHVVRSKSFTSALKAHASTTLKRLTSVKSSASERAKRRAAGNGTNGGGEDGSDASRKYATRTPMREREDGGFGTSRTREASTSRRALSFSRVLDERKRERASSEIPNAPASAFERWPSTKTPRRNRMDSSAWDEWHERYDVGAAGDGGELDAEAFVDRLDAEIEAMRERHSYVRQLTLDAIEHCKTLSELEPSFEALIRLEALDRAATKMHESLAERAREAQVEAEAKVEFEVAEATPASAHAASAARIELSAGGTLSQGSLSPITSTSALDKFEPRRELSLDDVEAELNNVRRLIQGDAT